MTLRDDEPPYTILLQRLAGSAQERKLLDLAEAAASQASPGSGTWWKGEFDGTRIPVAVTSEAVHYYLEKLDDFENGRWFTTSHGIEMLSAKLEYRASIAPAQFSGQPAYRADLDLKWFQHCGNLCALGFDKRRTVWLSPAGEILKIEGDGATDAIVS